MDTLELYDHIADLRDRLQAHYVRSPQEWVDITTASNGAVTLTIVSGQFNGISPEHRESKVRQVSQIGANRPVDIIWMTLATPVEAESLMLTPGNSASGVVASWLDFAYATLNSAPLPESSGAPRSKARVVVFYSYKGGVGRTTAMLHVAHLLAQQKKRIVLVDMDLEAPGLQHAVERLDPEPIHGLVDYLYERQLLPEGAKPTIRVQDIVGQVRTDLPSAENLYVVPAGRVDLHYIAMLDDLDSQVGSSGPQAWHTFLDELTDAVQPDLIFIDSRTGFSRWGAVSLLLLADEAFFFAYPNRQNMEGILPLLKALRSFGRPPLTIVFSMVPDTQGGKDLVESAWQKVAPLLSLPENHPHETAESQRGRPVVVHYDPALATASYLPLAYADAFRPLAARLSDIAEEAGHIEAIGMSKGSELDDAQRWQLVESIRIPTPFAEQDFDPDLFQPIEALAKVLKPEVSLIRGRKGTGKSYLYRMLQTRHIRDFAPNDGMLGVWTLVGHGAGVPGLDAHAFDALSKSTTSTQKNGISWEGIWGAYALVRLWQDEGTRRYGPRLPLSAPVFEPFKRVLGEIPNSSQRSRDRWSEAHTRVVYSLASLIRQTHFREVFSLIEEDSRASKRSRSATVWLLYDNLEFDLPAQRSYWPSALEGLFRFIYSLNEWGVTWLRPKVFIREDLWQQLKLTNKTHFEDHQVELKWHQLDLARLAYRLLTKSGAIADFIRQHYDVPDVDRADQEYLVHALGLIWGLRRARSGNAMRVYDWLYARMTDASCTTYPREMVHLLEQARRIELSFKGIASAPQDRLLRSEALDAGLAFASEKRCEALIADEYKSLAPFLNGMRGSPTQGELTRLEEVWRHTASNLEPQLDTFLRLLQDIGLVTIDNSKRIYVFADLYIDGLRLIRQPDQPV